LGYIIFKRKSRCEECLKFTLLGAAKEIFPSAPLHFMQIITIHQRKNNLVESDDIKLSFFFSFSSLLMCEARITQLPI